MFEVISNRHHPKQAPRLTAFPGYPRMWMSDDVSGIGFLRFSLPRLSTDATCPVTFPVQAPLGAFGYCAAATRPAQ